MPAVLYTTFLPRGTDIRGLGISAALASAIGDRSGPILAGSIAFLGAWNQYLWPLLVTKDDKYRTVQIGLKQLRATSIDQVNVTFAGVVITALPLVILLLVFQKQLVRGLTFGAVK